MKTTFDEFLNIIFDADALILDDSELCYPAMREDAVDLVLETDNLVLKKEENEFVKIHNGEFYLKQKEVWYRITVLNKVDPAELLK